jgi:hypothetical protein
MSKTQLGRMLALVAVVGGAACANAQSAQQTPAAATGDPPGRRHRRQQDVHPAGRRRWQQDGPAERARAQCSISTGARASIGWSATQPIERRRRRPAPARTRGSTTKRRGPITDADIQKA